MNFIKKNYIVLLVIFLNFIFLLNYLFRSTANIIYGDQFYSIGLIVTKFYEKNFNIFSVLKNVWEFGGIHRGVGGVFFILFNTKYFDFNTQVEIYFGGFILFITSLIIFFYYEKKLPLKNLITRMLFIPISFIIMNLDQAELLGNGNGLYLFCRMLFFVIVFINFENLIKKRSLKNLIFFITTLLMNTFLFSAGYTIPFLVALFIIFLLYFFINKSFKNKKFIIHFLVTVFFCLFIYINGITSHIVGYNPEPQRKETSSLFYNITNNTSSFLRFGLLGLTSNIINVNLVTIAKTVDISDLTLLIVGLVLLASYIYSIILFVKNKIYKITYMPLFFIIYAFLIYGSIAITRYSYNSLYPYYSMSSRYTLDTHYGLIGIIWILIYSICIEKNFNKQKIKVKIFKKIFLPILIMLFIITAQIKTAKTEWMIGPYRKEYFNTIRKIALMEKYNNKSEMDLFQNSSNPKLVIDSLKFLKKYKLNVFAE